MSEEKPDSAEAGAQSPAPDDKKTEPAAPAASSTGNANEKWQKFEQEMQKRGYVDGLDLITFFASLYGFVYAVVLFFRYAITNGPSVTWAGVWFCIIRILIYLLVLVFPLVAKWIASMRKRNADAFPLSFIKTQEDYRQFIVFLGFWSAFIMLCTGDTWWLHLITMVMFGIVVFADMLRKKFTKLPVNKPVAD